MPLAWKLLLRMEVIALASEQSSYLAAMPLGR